MTEAEIRLAVFRIVTKYHQPNENLEAIADEWLVWVGGKPTRVKILEYLHERQTLRTHQVLELADRYARYVESPAVVVKAPQPSKETEKENPKDPAPKKRGRPPGSKNKKSSIIIPADPL